MTDETKTDEPTKEEVDLLREQRDLDLEGLDEESTEEELGLLDDMTDAERAAYNADQARLAELYTESLDDEDDEPVRLNDDGPDFDGHDPDEDEDDDEEMTPVYGPVELSGRCEITLSISLHDVDNLEEALNTAAANLGRYGMDPFFVLALDPETGGRWVVNGGNVFREADADANPD